MNLISVLRLYARQCKETNCNTYTQLNLVYSPFEISGIDSFVTRISDDFFPTIHISNLSQSIQMIRLCKDDYVVIQITFELFVIFWFLISLKKNLAHI